MSDTNLLKCKNCEYSKSDHYKWVRNPDLDNGSDKDLNAGVCKISDCDCKHFEEHE